jgi:hypothetical protein
MFDQIKVQTFHVLLNFQIPFLRVLLKLTLDTNLPNGFDNHLINSHQKRFSVFVDDKFSLDLLNDAFVVFLYEFDKFLCDCKKFLV